MSHEIYGMGMSAIGREWKRTSEAKRGGRGKENRDKSRDDSGLLILFLDNQHVTINAEKLHFIKLCILFAALSRVWPSSSTRNNLLVQEALPTIMWTGSRSAAIRQSPSSLLTVSGAMSSIKALRKDFMSAIIVQAGRDRY